MTALIASKALTNFLEMELLQLLHTAALSLPNSTGKAVSIRLF